MSSHRGNSTPSLITFEGNQCLLDDMQMLGWNVFVKAQASLAAHRHPGTFEICYIVSGSVDWWAGGDVHEVGPGDVYITHPDEWHGGLDAMMHPSELYWVQVRLPPSDMLPADAEQLTRDFAQMKLRRFPGRPLIQHAFARLLATHVNPQRYSATLARAALHEILVAVAEDHEQHARSLRATRGAQSPTIRNALRWMEKHLSEDYSIEDAAAAAGLSVSHFHERFSAEVGFTPADHRARARVSLAKQMLRAGERSITEVAIAAGFSTSQYFATVFKTLTGMTPREYRRLSSSVAR